MEAGPIYHWRNAFGVSVVRGVKTQGDVSGQLLILKTITSAFTRVVYRVAVQRFVRGKLVWPYDQRHWFGFNSKSLNCNNT